MERFIPIFLIAVSASLWGMIAIFVRTLSDAGFTSMEIVTLRVVTAVIILGIIGIFRYPKQMTIKVSDVKLFIGTGILSIVFFNWCYFTSINQLNLSFAVILLYTSPAFVVILSSIFLKERMNQKKLLSVLGTIIGCILIAGVSLNDTGTMNLAGLVTGLGAGLGYALYSIFGKFALNKYTPFTVTLYTFLIAAITLLPITGLWEKARLLVNGEVLLYSVGLGLLPTVIAYIFYTKGLEKVESSKAAIVATVEPVVATILSVFLYRESFGLLQFTGTAVILLSVIFINLPKDYGSKKHKEKASIT
ncbi:DMT family transporter [Bacillus sp. MRMR6]|uniref:DMT family transporter n=1 Tax=Bacillus sp. MRMR6 TaxID=1928617 RepID=UPI00095139BC|nr:EamA family transporter [Bacillus sp. MRMR6]OLS40288.1 EamA family transporter [Bacillus sp. MRMR6]